MNSYEIRKYNMGVRSRRIVLIVYLVAEGYLHLNNQAVSSLHFREKVAVLRKFNFPWRFWAVVAIGNWVGEVLENGLLK